MVEDILEELPGNSVPLPLQQSKRNMQKNVPTTTLKMHTSQSPDPNHTLPHMAKRNEGCKVN